MHREYIAFVEGQPAAPRGTWRDWVQLSRDEMRQMVVEAPAGDRQHVGIARDLRRHDLERDLVAGAGVLRDERIPDSSDPQRSGDPVIADGLPDQSAASLTRCDHGA